MSKIDILLATYNGEKYIEEQIDSIINQSFKEWNLIIRDDGSTDKTVSILEKYIAMDKRIVLLNDQKGNLGFIKNFEELLSNSNSDYSMFCDQDDLWLENKVMLMYNEMDKRIKKEGEIPILIHSDTYVVDKNLNIIRKNFVKRRAVKKGFASLVFSNSVQGSTIMINRKLREKALPFITNLPFDSYLGLLSELIGKRFFLNKSLMYYRQHETNVIGDTIAKSEKKVSYLKSILNKFDLENFGGFEEFDKELNKIENKFKVKNKEKKVINDFRYIINSNGNRIFKIYKFYKNNFILYSRIKYVEMFLFLLTNDYGEKK